MADEKDELKDRRWFRQRLAKLAQQYPPLQEPASQERLVEALPQLFEEDSTAMPRQPTGRPTGRPPGSGRLGAEGTGHKRLTVRLPVALYDDLEAEAEAACEPYMLPDLARTVRTALAHYLTCPQRRQTGSAPRSNLATNGQTGNAPEVLEDNTRQTDIIPQPAHTSEAAPKTRHDTDTVTDTETVTVAGQALEPFDTTRYYLGKLCPKGHDYQGTGQSLLRKHNQHCRECENEGKRARRQARRQAPAL